MKYLKINKLYKPDEGGVEWQRELYRKLEPSNNINETDDQTKYMVQLWPRGVLGVEV